MKNRFALKAATDGIHRELDERLSRLDLARSDDYRRFLHFHGRSVPAVESALEAGGLDAFVEGWSGHRRSEAIAQDLAELGEPMPKPIATTPLSGVGELLGTAYVLEGSRLGGRVLKQRVGNGFPSRFLSGSDGRGPWLHVIAALDGLLYSDRRLSEATHAARNCFALFLGVAEEAGI